jgi:hypothetical protein
MLQGNLSNKNPNWHVTEDTEEPPDDDTQLPKHVRAAK